MFTVSRYFSCSRRFVCCVVSSLWKVGELSTAFLLIKFYETLPKNPQKGEIAVSLKNAQKWLQTLTLDQFEQELERFQLIVVGCLQFPVTLVVPVVLFVVEDIGLDAFCKETD